MSNAMSQPVPSASSATATACTPAAPPSRSEIERKLSFKSAASPRIDQSPRKRRSPSNVSGNDSDTSLSSAQGHSQSASIASPLLSPSLNAGPPSLGTGAVPAPTTRQLSAIAERLNRDGAVEEVEEYEEQDEGEEDVSDEDVDAGERKGQGELERGMEGERVLRAGYLYKKQEKRKVWKKKWFVLRTGKLAYYKDDREYSLSRVMDLRIIHTAAPVKVKKHSFTFGIVTKKRTFIVEASSQGEMDEWVGAINLARRKLTEEAQAPAQGTQKQGSGIENRSNQGDGYTSATAGTSPVINTSFLGRTGISSPVNASPAQLYPNSGLPAASLAESGQPGLISQMGRMGVSPSQPVGAPSQPIRTGSSSARREPSASSLSSTGGADYFPRTPSASQSPHPNSALSPTTPGGTVGIHTVSSDSEEMDGETYFSDIANPNAQPSQFGTSVGTTKSLSLSMMSTQAGPVDPARIILSAYLMKRSKGRGRKVWRKRWFYLTSQGLTYTKSHMDTKTLRNIPLSSILDAIDQSSALDDVDPSSSDSEAEPSSRSRPARSPSLSKSPSSKPGQSSTTSAFGSTSTTAQGQGEHTFRLVTAKRSYVLCAPTEEDEIKWLAAVKALLNRERGASSPLTEMAPRLYPSPGVSRQQGQVPTITQQPPTPGSTTSTGTPGLAPPLPNEITQETSTAGRPGSVGMRGRSATYLAKSAVEDVERRYHPEQRVG